MTFKAINARGPVVRVAPNEITINTIDRGVRIVHGGGFRSLNTVATGRITGAYSSYSQYHAFNSQVSRFRNSFSSLGEDHRHRRRRVTSPYTKRNIQGSSHVQMIKYVLLFERLLPQYLQHAASNQPLNVLPLNIAYGLDFVSAFAFGLSRGSNFLRDVRARNDWLDTFLAAQSTRTSLLVVRGTKFTKVAHEHRYRYGS